MKEGTVKIKNPMGFHTGPASVLCNAAVRFQSAVTLIVEGSEFNAKSFLSVLGAGVKYGDEITLAVQGSDEEEAFRTVYELIESGLGEL